MLDLQTLYILLGLLGFVCTIAVFIWKASWWTNDRFKELRELIYRQIQQLEDKFDQRHIDNIQRFTRLETKLDIIKNGHQ